LPSISHHCSLISGPQSTKLGAHNVPDTPSDAMTMSEAKERLSPIKKVKAAFIKSPKSPTSAACEITPTEEKAVTELSLRMEEIYFDDPRSRECLSVNPGDHLMHEQERKKCTAENWKAEIERRIVAGSKMVDHAYDDKNPFRRQAYGHGDGQK